MSKATHRWRVTAIRWVTPLVVFIVVLAALFALNREPSTDPLASLGPAGDSAGLSEATATSISELEGAVRAEPDSAPWTALGNTYLLAARETADSAYLERAGVVFDRALTADPDDVNATIGQGSVALSGHRFRDALKIGRTASEQEPQLVAPLPVIIDAQIELGRYGAAAATLNDLLSEKPTLAAYTRDSYFRELHGDLAGATRSMRLAVSAGGGSIEPVSFAQGLVGHLQIASGDYKAAEVSFRSALSLEPDDGPALAGLAALEMGREDYAGAVRGYADAMASLPNAEHAARYADALAAAGREDDAEAAFAEAIEIARADPVEINQELALLLADHGDSGEAVQVARKAWRLAPGVASADALAWALYRDGDPQAAWTYTQDATALGSKDAGLLARAAEVAVAAGHQSGARTFVARAHGSNPRAPELDQPNLRKLIGSQ